MTEQMFSKDDVAQMIQDALDKRDKDHAEQLAAVRAAYPQALVPIHGGGPGSDNHQPSWSLAEQEAATRGEDHWSGDSE
jgi:hypothetical protein